MLDGKLSDQGKEEEELRCFSIKYPKCVCIK